MVKQLKIYFNHQERDEFDALIKDLYLWKKDQSKLKYYDKEPNYNYFDQPSPKQLENWNKNKTK